MATDEITKIIVFTFLNHKDKWVSVNGLSRASGLPQDKVWDFIQNTSLVKRAKKKNRRGNVLYTLTDEAREKYQLEKKDYSAIFSDTKALLEKGKLDEAIESYYAVLKGNTLKLPDILTSIYKDKLQAISTDYFLLNDLWLRNEVSTEEKFSAADQFIYKLYESIIEIEYLIEELQKYQFRFKNVSIKIDQDFRSFQKEDSSKVLSQLSKLLEINQNDISIKEIKEGSVLMTLEFESSEQAELLFLMIKLGKLKQEGIVDAKLKALSERLDSKKDKKSERSQLCKDARQHIQNGHTRLAVDLLSEKLDLIDTIFHNEILLLSSDLSNVEQSAALSLEKIEDTRIARNKITFSLLNLIDRIGKS